MKTRSIHGYEVFENSPYNADMPLLAQEGLRALNTHEMMQDIVIAHETKDYKKRDFLVGSFKDSLTACPHYANTFGVIHDSKYLTEINEKTKLVNRAVPLTKKQYKKLMKEYGDWFLKRNQKGVIIGRNQTKEEAMNSPVLFYLAGKNKDLHESFVKLIFELGKQKYDYDTMIGIYLPDDQKNPELRDWFFKYLGSRSNADARYGLADDVCRLLGVRVQNLEEVVQK